MDDYNFWADVMITFRTSSDMVKTIWVLSAALTLALTLLSRAYAWQKLRTSQCQEQKKKRLKHKWQSD